MKESQLRQLIREEISKVLMEQELNEGWGKKSPEEALKIIMSHPSKKRAYEAAPKDRQEKFIQFIQSNPEARYFNWDSAKGKYVDQAVTSDPSGLTGTRKLGERKFK
jgi:hypothetical protein